MGCNAIQQYRCRYTTNASPSFCRSSCLACCPDFHPYIPDIHIYDASVIKTVDTLEDLYSINVKHMPDGKIVKVLNGPDGDPLFYFYDRETESWIETNFVAWSVVGG